MKFDQVRDLQRGKALLQEAFSTHAEGDVPGCEESGDGGPKEAVRGAEKSLTKLNFDQVRDLQREKALLQEAYSAMKFTTRTIFTSKYTTQNDLH